ncbi:MAG: RDD family protein, partial [Variovorax sp.]
GVALRLPAAGPLPRALAWLIDLVIRMGLLVGCSTVLGLLGEAGTGIYLVLLFGVFWLYPILCECLLDGRTPGKRVLDLRVVSSDGAPVGWLASCVRNLMRTVDMLPFGYATGLVCGLLDPWGRRLGDLVAGTMVVHAPRARAWPSMEGGEVQAPVVPLRPAEQAAIVAFAERAPRLTAERQAELADIAAAAVGAGGAEGVQRLAGTARWLLGKR